MRRLCRAASTLAAVSLVLLPGEEGRTQTKPNIVAIMADDLDVNTLATLVASGMMPNLKRYLVDVGLWLNALKTCRGIGCHLLENYFSFN